MTKATVTPITAGTTLFDAAEAIAGDVDDAALRAVDFAVRAELAPTDPADVAAVGESVCAVVISLIVRAMRAQRAVDLRLMGLE
jgi:hypothetical protein